MTDSYASGPSAVVADLTDGALATATAGAGDAVEQRLLGLLAAASEVALSPDQLLDVARAAAALGDHELKAAVGTRIADEAAALEENVGTWELTLHHNKVDGWVTTGRRAAVLAEAWALVRA